jgi:hypothetical protein
MHFRKARGPGSGNTKKTGVNGKNRGVEKPFISLYGTLPSISIIFATSEHTGQDFFLSENKSLNNSNPERAIIIPNATIKMNANGRAGQELHEDKKRRRYHIIPTDKMMLPSDPSTAHSGGAAVSDI